MATGLEEHHLRGIRASLEHAESCLGSGVVKASEMAWHACMSPFHFERIFLRAVGISPGTYVRSRRLTEAAQRLLHHRSSAAEIGRSLGYGSAAAFHRAFKSQFFLNPGELRGYGFLPSLMVPRAMLPRDGFPAMAATYRPSVRQVQVPMRRLVGLFLRGDNEHGANFRLDYQLLPISAGLCDPEDWLCFDRLHPQAPHYEVFLGWEVSSLAQIPEGLSGLEIPSHPSLLVTYMGRIDDRDEVFRRERIREECAREHGAAILSQAWKLTRSRPSPSGAGFRDWEIEIPLA